MAQKELENEVKQALQYIKSGENFILEGGAGSGKTYSLISLINELSLEYPEKSIVCITYTNNAVAEIKSRINNENFLVSTIHEFMWNTIKKYQNEIKLTLVNLINDENYKIFTKPKEVNEDSIVVDIFKNVYVEYDEYYSMTPNGENKIKISHNHVLIIAEKMFEKYKKLSDIFKDMANYIFIDEYQDTDSSVARILLKHIKNSNKKNVVGFFGDSMQAIYDEGVGDLEGYSLKKIIKKQNRRNPRTVIEVANKFREDGIEQEPSTDYNAPNMENGHIIEGSVKFIYGKGLNDINLLKNKEIFSEWNFTESGKIKELRLTHKYNADMSGFKGLFDLYNNDSLIKIIEKVRIETSKKNISIIGKTFEKLVSEINSKSLLDKIKSTIDSIYQDIKDSLWEEIMSKYRIKSESLLGYKLNGLNRKYEAKSSRDRILQRLDSVSELLELYETKRYNEFLRQTHFIIENKNDKIELEKIMSFLSNSDNKTIEEVLKFAEEHKLLKEDDLFNNFIINKGFYLWEKIKKILFIEYKNSIKYLKEFFPIATQHSVKGSEYDNILVILASNWNNYDFSTLFGEGSTSNSVKRRTKKLFYVSITRAKRNLVIYMQIDEKKNVNNIIEKAKEYFGENNVISIEELK